MPMALVASVDRRGTSGAPLPVRPAGAQVAPPPPAAPALQPIPPPPPPPTITITKTTAEPPPPPAEPRLRRPGRPAWVPAALSPRRLASPSTGAATDRWPRWLWSASLPDAVILAIRQSSQNFGLKDPRLDQDQEQTRRTGDINTLARAIVHAANLGARVINISLVSCIPVTKPTDQAVLGRPCAMRPLIETW